MVEDDDQNRYRAQTLDVEPAFPIGRLRLFTAHGIDCNRHPARLRPR